MTFANIEYLFLLPLIIPYIIWYVLRHKKSEPAMRVSDTHMYLYAPKSYKHYLISQIKIESKNFTADLYRCRLSQWDYANDILVTSLIYSNDKHIATVSFTAVGAKG